VYDIQNCLIIPGIICRITCVKARRVITPLKFHRQFLVYIKRHLNYTFHILFSILVITVICYPELACLFYSIPISQLVVKNLDVDLRLITSMSLAYLCNFVFVLSVTIHFNVYVFRKGLPVIIQFKLLLIFIYKLIFCDKKFSFKTGFRPFWK
jgi:hypothetical protein